MAISLTTWARLALLTQRLKLTRLSYWCAHRAGFFQNYYDQLDGHDGY